MPVITGPILDSSGRPANGWLRVRASRPFETADGLVTSAYGVAKVEHGIPLAADGEWSLPATPEDVLFVVEQDLDGEILVKFSMKVPDVDRMSYANLLYGRGGAGVGGPEPWTWNLDAYGGEFPPEAVTGDTGLEASTGNYYRFTGE